MNNHMAIKSLVFVTFMSKNVYGDRKNPEVFLVDEETATKIREQFDNNLALIKFNYHHVQNGLDDIRGVVKKSSSVDHVEFHAATDAGTN